LVLVDILTTDGDLPSIKSGVVDFTYSIDLLKLREKKEKQNQDKVFERIKSQKSLNSLVLE